VDVKLLAHTELPYDALSLGTGEDDYKDGIFIDPIKNWMLGDMELDPDATDMDTLVEFAGRACYQSFHKPSEKTRTNGGYMANIINQGHFSVMEHASFTVYVTGVSRALTHELVRHRHLSFSQLSQRFVNEEDTEFVVPPALRDALQDHPYDLGDGVAGDELGDVFEQVKYTALAAYEEIVKHLQECKGLTRKQAREAARAVLPNMTETRIVVTGNLRAWRDVITRRIDPAADAEIQEFARRVLAIAKEVAPACFQDFEVPNAG
jgi:thymidylate synthase (FAD)